MTIATVELTQQQNYQQTLNQSRKITLLAPSKASQQQVNNEPTVAPNALINSSTIQTKASHDEIEPVTYERPKELKLQLMILVLERFLGRTLDLSELSFDSSSGQLSKSKVPSSSDVFSLQTADKITIDGQSFQQNDRLSVEQWHSHEQQLNYQVQGIFDVNNQSLSLNYNFSLSSEQISYSKVEMTATTLKDPLIVQFGSQGLGTIAGQTDFAINQDDTLDSLPIFSGDVGYLVLDKNSNQQADDGSELFGPTTGQGFAELAQLDSNSNGFIDVDDKQFEQLYLWQPSDNQNQTEQWLSLKEAQIQAISLSAITTPFDFYDQNGEVQAQLRQSSFAITDGGVGRGVHQVDVRI